MFRLTIVALLNTLVIPGRGQESLTINYGDTQFMDSAHFLTYKYFILKKNLTAKVVTIHNYYFSNRYAIATLVNGKLGEFDIVAADSSRTNEEYSNDTIFRRTQFDSSGTILYLTEFDYPGLDTVTHTVVYYKDGKMEDEGYSINGKNAYRSAHWDEKGVLRVLRYYRKAAGKMINSDSAIAFSDDELSNRLITLDSAKGMYGIKSLVYVWYENKMPYIDYVWKTSKLMRQNYRDSIGEVTKYFSYRYGKIRLDANYDYDNFRRYAQLKGKGTKEYFRGWYLDGISYINGRKIKFKRGKARSCKNSRKWSHPSGSI